jgi:8-oxo-dGTP pyrophosphatase MutT (NUDIX family)
MIFSEKPSDFNNQFSVVSCFVEVEDEILLLHRQDHKPQGGTWGIPAGKIQPGETMRQAMVRELSEETGHQENAWAFRYRCCVFVRYPNADFEYHIFKLPIPHKIDVQLNPDEHKDFKWCRPEQALELNLIPDEDPCIRKVYRLP